MDKIGPSRVLPAPAPPAPRSSNSNSNSNGPTPGIDAVGTRAEYNKFQASVRRLLLRYLTSSSLPLRLLGWEELESVLRHADRMRPPPRDYVASGAGCPYVNGVFEFGAEIDVDGWAVVAGGGGSSYAGSSGELKYLRRVPASELPKKTSKSSTDDGGAGGGGGGGAAGADDNMADGAEGPAQPQPPLDGEASAPEEGEGKVITLFRCTMRSSQKWWFLSEADADQPGTDKDIDYYQHKSKTPEEMNLPPSEGWVTCGSRSDDGPGRDPPPHLRPRGLMVSPGQEGMALTAQISTWAVKNNVVELVLGGMDGGGTHREVVSRSISLIEFMAKLGRRWEEEEEEERRVSAEDEQGSDMEVECLSPSTMSRSAAIGRETLSTSHLSLAWETYISNPDESVTNEVRRLLVTVLPKLTDKLAIHLLQLVAGSMDRNEKAQNLDEIVELCSALAVEYPVIHPADDTVGKKEPQPQQKEPSHALSAAVRSQFLLLLWSVLNHPDASSSSSQLRPEIENLKEYVRNELRYHPKNRMNFLDGCRSALERNAASTAPIDAPVDEKITLRTVNLTRFVLQACPSGEAEEVVAGGREPLASLLFRELAAYLKRQKAVAKANDGSRAKGDLLRKVCTLVLCYSISPPLFSLLYRAGSLHPQ